MLLAMFEREGKKILILGLQEENMRRLVNDEPLFNPLDMVPGLEEWILMVIGPEDLARFLAQIGASPDGS